MSSNTPHETDYPLLASQLDALLADETDALANTANFVALLHSAIDDINWLGVYVVRDGELVLGPFQGQPACVRIGWGKGVCGTAAKEQRTLRVEDVHEFPGHIVCDAASRSELVVPLIWRDEVLGVLDIDSPLLGRFSETDEVQIAALCQQFLERLFGNGDGAHFL